MGTFKSNAITKQGRNLIAKGIAGAQIKFTRMAIGSGYLPAGHIPYEQTALVQKVMDIEIVKNKLLGEGKVVLGGYFNNSDVTGDGFYYREVGAYAFDPDANKEILFSYGNAGEDAEKIEPVGVGGLVSKSIDLITAVDKAENIMVEINPGGLITVEMLKEHKTGMEAAVDAAIEKALRSQHPVGHVYITQNKADDPNVRFAGTWALTSEGRMLVGAAQNATAGQQGGADTATLTEHNLANHAHSVPLIANVATGGENVSHTHSFSGGTGSAGEHAHSVKWNYTAQGGSNIPSVRSGGTSLTDGIVQSAGAHAHTFGGGTSAASNAHGHYLNVPAHSTNTAGAGQAFSVKNRWQSAFFWLRVS